LKISDSPLYQLTQQQAKLSPEAENAGLVKLMSIEFCGGDDNPLYLEALLRNVKVEMKENLSIPIDHSIKESYINEVLKLYNGFEEQIVENDNGQFDFPNIEFVDIPKEELDKKDNDIYENTIEFYKKSIRNEIKQLYNELIELRGSVFPKSPPPINEKTSEKKEEKELISLATDKEIIVRAFAWTRKNSFKEDMLKLHALLTHDKYSIIPKDTDFKDFTYAFSGRFLSETLKIKWCVIGKNNYTSKSSLFHFISQLEDYKLIENKDWSEKNNSLLYQKIYSIFTDKDGNPFTVEGLSTSRSQGLGTECAKQSEINEIVKIIANLKSDNISNS